MAVITADSPKVSDRAREPQIQRCGGASVPAVADSILLRERLRSRQLLLSARPLPAARVPAARVPAARVPAARVPAARVPAARGVAGPVDCPRSAPARGYRWGRWERLGMTLVVTAAVLVAGLTVWGGSATPTRDAVVLPGDTMLSIALREMPNVDPARAAELIDAANGGASVRIVPGATLTIPLVR